MNTTQTQHTPTLSKLELLWMAAAVTSCDERGFNRVAFEFISGDAPDCASLPHGDQMSALFAKLVKPEARAHIVHCVNSRASLLAENKRLREALKEIAGMDIRYSGTNNVAVAATDTARAALSTEGRT